MCEDDMMTLMSAVKNVNHYLVVLIFVDWQWISL